MEFEEAQIIAKQSNGALVVRGEDGTFQVRLSDGSLLVDGSSVQVDFTGEPEQDGPVSDIETLLDNWFDFYGYKDISNSESNSNSECLTTFLVKSTIDILELSKKTVGIFDQQEEVEYWLFSLLQEIQKIKPDCFPYGWVQELDKKVALEGCRKRIQPLDKDLAVGMNIIVKNEIYKVTEWSGGHKLKRFANARSCWQGHLNRSKVLINVFDSVDTRMPPDSAAQSFVKVLDEREEALTVKRLEQERIKMEARHKERLDRLGKEYLGVRKATLSPSRQRVTHCWFCKKSLDSTIDVECMSCNWILCKCGACGCGYGS